MHVRVNCNLKFNMHAIALNKDKQHFHLVCPRLAASVCQYVTLSGCACWQSALFFEQNYYVLPILRNTIISVLQCDEGRHVNARNFKQVHEPRGTMTHRWL